MPILDLCSKQLPTVQKDSTLQFTARFMKSNNVGAVIITEANGKNKPIGILTDRDIVLGVVAENKPLTTKVQDIMSKNILKVSKNKGIAEVIGQMETKGVRRVLLVDDKGEACGLVSSDDVLRLVAKELYSLGKIAEKQSIVATADNVRQSRQEFLPAM